MEQTALILIIISLVFLVIITALLTLLLYRLLNKQDPASHAGPEINTHFKHLNGLHPGIIERLRPAKAKSQKRSEIFCPNHSEEPGEVTCSICDNIFCRSCAKPFKTMHFCKEHLPMLMRHTWIEVLTIKTSSTDPEEGVRLYDLKKKLFEQENIPTYIENHYKIDIERDLIETFLVMFAIEDQIKTVKEWISSNNSP
jgi:hypothetical protein